MHAIFNVSQATAIQRAKNLRGAAAGYQQSVIWAVGQALNGNADGLFQIMQAAGLLANQNGQMTTYKAGRQVWQYVTTPQSQGGCGLVGVIRWDKDSQSFKMTKGWTAKAASLDTDALAETLTNVRWDQMNKTKKAADSAFDLEKAIKTLVTRAANNGVTEEELVRKFLDLRAA